ncbi:LivK ABC-type branched-chain amino acid transport systems, periplasmic component [Oxalobacteraceae bacterium]|jgi:branched-chain amino acid transport system substrate-binding protein|nr:ABC transporter substrate-binding protein [Oxalobacteraceae bacterium]
MRGNTYRWSFSALMLIAVMTSPAKAQNIRIGLSGPFSGGSSPMGESMRNGIRLAVQEINAIGGIHGRTIELIERDDQANNELGAKIATELTRMKVTASIGIVNTGVGLASIDTYQQARIPLMIAVSTGPVLTRRYAPPASPANFIFRVSPTLDLEARMLAADLKKRGISKVALLADDTPYGDSGANAFAEAARQSAIELVTTQRFKIGDTDMSRPLKNARTAGAQAVVGWGIGPELAQVAHGMMRMAWRVPFMGSWTLSMRNFIDAAGSAGEGALLPQTFIQDAGSAAKNSFLLAYRRQFNTDMIPSPMSAAQGYDGMHLLALALRQSKTLDGDAIRHALENLESRYQGVVTSYEKPFTAQDHEAISANMMVIARVSSGRVDYAYREDQQRSALLKVKSK